MAAPEWLKVKQLFDAAVERDPAERDTFVLEACGSDDTLLAEVRSLLAHEAPAREFLGEHSSSLLSEMSRAADSMADPRIDTIVGHYRIKELIASGGMGTVYVAERDDRSYEKRVALKIIKRGLDTDDILQRFRNERQVLASLEHPSICRLVDGGATDDGVPYLVMEHVNGAPIDQYCDERQLSLTERLQLFLTVCEAVQYAHQNLVVHRDLKPSNILVDGDQRPKLLDFGIAKVLDPSQSERTAPDSPLFTPRYASPEQIRGEQVSVSSDVYALGVVLYELLTGHRPYEFTTHTLDEYKSVICERTPPRPSTVVGTTTATSQADDTREVTPEFVSAARSIDPKKLRRQLEGDLDNIVLMALRKERSRRYASVAEFADDIQCYLTKHPVRARPATLWYRTSTFVRRNRVGVGAVGLVLISLVVGLVGVSWQAKLTGEQRDLAAERFEDIRELAHSLIFEIHDEIRNMPGATAARERLVLRAKAYLDSLATEAGDDPTLLVEVAHCYERLGEVQCDVVEANLGDTDSALESHRKALAIRRQLVAISPKDFSYRRGVMGSLQRIGDVLRLQGNLSGAREAYREAEQVSLGLAADHPDEVEPARLLMVAYLKNGIADSMQGAFDDARVWYEDAHRLGEAAAAKSPDNPDLQRTRAVAIEKVGDSHQVAGDAATALACFREASVLHQALLDREPTSVRHKHSLAIIYSKIGEALGHPAYSNVGDQEGALAAFITSRDLFQELQDNDPDDVRSRKGLCVLFRRVAAMHALADRRDEALAGYEAACAIARRAVRDNTNNMGAQADLASCLSGIAATRFELGKFEAARGSYKEALSIQKAIWKQDGTWVTAKEGMATCTLGIAASHSRSSKAAESTSERVQELQSAIEWYELAHQHFSDLKRNGSLVASYEQYLDKIPGRIADCAAALEELGVARPAGSEKIEEIDGQ